MRKHPAFIFLFFHEFSKFAVATTEELKLEQELVIPAVVKKENDKEK